MGLTFKINQPTGRYRSFDHISIDIKLDKQEVGTIGWRTYLVAVGDGIHKAQTDGMRVSLRVKSDAFPGWKNVTLKKTFEGFSDKEQGNAAKQWVKDNWATITEKYQLSPSL